MSFSFDFDADLMTVFLLSSEMMGSITIRASRLMSRAWIIFMTLGKLSIVPRTGNPFMSFISSGIKVRSPRGIKFLDRVRMAF